MTDKIRWGILSTSAHARKFIIPAIHRSSNGVVSAIASRNLERASAIASEMDIPQTYGSYEELIAAPDIDAIFNPLPNHLHAKWSIEAAKAGKPVLCEKPIASDAAEARQMVEAFADAGVLLGEAFMYRHHPRTKHVKQMVQDGAVGEVLLADAAFTFKMSPDRENDIRLQKDMAGGALMDVGCYCVSVIRHMLGEEPLAAHAFAHFGEKSGVDEWLVGVMEFPSGALGHLDCGFRSTLTQYYEIRGTEGRIRVEFSFTPHKDEQMVIRHWRGDDHYEEITTEAADQYQVMVEDFADAILNDRPILFPVDDAVRNMAAIDMLYASARGG
jgi:xylose dehydrogenase (NAD/NADP)